MTFGVLLGLVYATTGVLIAALVTYYAGRLLPKKTLQRLAGDALEPAGKLLREHGVVAVFGANMVPTPPFVVQNMIAGAVRIPLWKFLLGTFLALVPGMLAWTVFGDQINAALEDSSQDELVGDRRRDAAVRRLHLHRASLAEEALSGGLTSLQREAHQRDRESEHQRAEDDADRAERRHAAQHADEHGERVDLRAARRPATAAGNCRSSPRSRPTASMKSAAYQRSCSASTITAGTQTTGVPASGISAASAASTPNTTGEGSPTTAKPMPTSTPCTSAVTPVP